MPAGGRAGLCPGGRQGFEPHDAPAPSLEGRVDLRDELSFTIDPETAKDFDDALTLKDDRAYVHIADVSYFVPAGTPLDRGAAERAFSTYVPGRVAPMLPPDLSEDLCSLRPHEDRLCVTVEIPLPAGEPTFYRSVIRSRERLTYGRAEAILAGREQADAELTQALRRAEAVSTELRGRCGERARDRVFGKVGPGQGGFPRARAALAQAGALRPAQPRPLGPRKLRLLPFHLADPPLSRPHRPPRSAARTGHVRGPGTAGSRRACRAHVSAGARRGGH